jgi:predicted ester cyclase
MPDNKAIVHRYIERVWDNQEYAAIDDMIAEDDKVAWHWTIRGRHSGDFQDIPPTGKAFLFTGMSLLRLDAGKFAELWVEQDLAGLIQ